MIMISEFFIKANSPQRRGDAETKNINTSASPRLCGLKSFRKNSRKIREAFKFERVAARVEKKHRRLLADFARETDFRLDDEFHAVDLEALSEGFEVFHFQNDSEMRNRNVVGVNFVFVPDAGGFRREMRDDLVSEQIKINPLVGASAFFAA